MMAHTPGPWHRNIKPARKYPVVFAGRNTHVAVVQSQGLADEECEANTNLIAASPDLLAMLRSLSHLAETINNRRHAGLEITPIMWSELYGRTNQAKALIAEATGDV